MAPIFEAVRLGIRVCGAVQRNLYYRNRLFLREGYIMTNGEIGLTYLIATIVAFVVASMMMKKGS
jgi:hypothetical protein